MPEAELHEPVPKGYLLAIAEAAAKCEKLEQAVDELEGNTRPLIALRRRAMVDTGAGASIFPRGFSQHSVPDATREPIVLSTATDEEVKVDDGKTNPTIVETQYASGITTPMR